MSKISTLLVAGVALIALSGTVKASERPVTGPIISSYTHQVDPTRIQLAEGEDDGCEGDCGGEGGGGDLPGNSDGNAHGANENRGLNAGGGNGSETGDPGNSETHNQAAVSGERSQSDASVNDSDGEDNPDQQP
jgi:hypothetical protein